MEDPFLILFGALPAASLLIPGNFFLAYWFNHKGMHFWWTASFACFHISSGSALLSLHSFLPTFASKTLSIALFGSGYFLCMRSVRKLKNSWKLHQVDELLTCAYMIGLATIFVAGNSFTARLSLISSFTVAMSLTACLSFHKCATPLSRLGDVALWVFAIGTSCFSTLRAIAAIASFENNALTHEFFDRAFLTWIFIAIFLYVIGLFLNGTALIAREAGQALEKERGLKDSLNEALEGQRNLQKLILHEIKRPLNTITTEVSKAHRSKLGLSNNEIDQVYLMTGLANAYLNGISEYEDLETLLTAPILIEVRVQNLIEDIRNKWRVRIQTLEGCESTVISIDILLFDIAIGNLIENANKFGISEGSVRLNIGKDDHFVFFDVCDDGKGIPPDEAEKVFQRFYQIDSTRRNIIKGCGLGLYMVRRIAETHSGTCYVVSERPSVLRFSVPITVSSGERYCHNQFGTACEV